MVFTQKRLYIASNIFSANSYLKKSVSLFLFVFFSILTSSTLLAQEENKIKNDSITNKASNDTIPKPKSRSEKMEQFFKKYPAPMYSYSQEGGHLFGLAKYNLFKIYADTITSLSKISGTAYVTTNGRYNFYISSEIIFRENRYILLNSFNYKRTPEFILGIGNDVKVEDAEEISVDLIKGTAYFMTKVASKTYFGGGLDVSSYYNVELVPNSILLTSDAVGLDGSTNIGIGAAFAYDTRDNRYYSTSGSYFLATSAFFNKAYGCTYNYSKIILDFRKFFIPWKKHVLAFQATTTYSVNDVPFFELAQLGGDSQMRGYYKGALRDKVLIDGQTEYRMPIWKAIGVVAWLGAGRVAPAYEKLSFDRVWISYGTGLRFRVDSKNNTNLRLDFGWGSSSKIHAINFGFAEAF
ncbi:hypothetical protein FEDK69T_22570 [Flavobacterium enshiense DK69]|nr:BamA/TamA family outer membrane protein [Flavobacterium enshiense]ESU22275.1 hypothetical protein FEDK69T_22570 [Flavobacterium enshiense DK69]